MGISGIKPGSRTWNAQDLMGFKDEAQDKDCKSEKEPKKGLWRGLVKPLKIQYKTV